MTDYASFNAFSAFLLAATIPAGQRRADERVSMPSRLFSSPRHLLSRYFNFHYALFQCLLGFSPRRDYGIGESTSRKTPSFNAFSAFLLAATNLEKECIAAGQVSMPSRLFSSPRHVDE